MKLHDYEPDVQVCRSIIDDSTWYCYDMDGTRGDMTSWSAPGPVRKVKRWAEQQFARGQRVRWQRIDGDTWQLRIVRPRSR